MFDILLDEEMDKEKREKVGILRGLQQIQDVNQTPAFIFCQHVDEKFISSFYTEFFSGSFLQAANNLVVLSREDAGAERIFQSNGVALLLNMIETGKAEMILAAVRTLSGMCTGHKARVSPNTGKK